jgi:hypothetical protein
VVFILGFECGLRTGEIAALRWSDINFRKRLIKVSRTIYRGFRKVRPRAPSATSASPTPLLDALTRLERRGPRVLYRCSQHTAGKYAEHTEHSVKAALNRLQREVKFDRTGLHILRHSGITYLADRGEDIYTVQAFARHARLQTTQGYIHQSKQRLVSKAARTFDGNRWQRRATSRQFAAIAADMLNDQVTPEPLWNLRGLTAAVWQRIGGCCRLAPGESMSSRHRPARPAEADLRRVPRRPEVHRRQRRHLHWLRPIPSRLEIHRRSSRVAFRSSRVRPSTPIPPPTVPRGPRPPFHVNFSANTTRPRRPAHRYPRGMYAGFLDLTRPAPLDRRRRPLPLTSAPTYITPDAAPDSRRARADRRRTTVEPLDRARDPQQHPHHVGRRRRGHELAGHASARRSRPASPASTLVGANPRLRLYRYRQGERHGAHWDTVVELADGVRSLLTLVFYLNENFTGGATDFVELGARGHPKATRPRPPVPTPRHAPRLRGRPSARNTCSTPISSIAPDP